MALVMAACPPQNLIDLKCLMKMSDGCSVRVARLSRHGHSLIRIILQNTRVITGIHPHQQGSQLQQYTAAKAQGQQQHLQEELDDTQGQRAPATADETTEPIIDTNNYTYKQGKTDFSLTPNVKWKFKTQIKVIKVNNLYLLMAQTSQMVDSLLPRLLLRMYPSH